MRFFGVGFFFVICLLFARVAGAQTQYELTISASESYQKADGALNQLYKEIMHGVPEKQKPLIKQAEIAWLNYRDKCVESEAAIYAGGSIESMIRINAKRDLTLERIERLRVLLPEVVNRYKTALPDLTEQKEKWVKADARLNKVYKDRMSMDSIRPQIKEAQRAWLAYRDACIKSEIFPFEGSAVAVETITAKCSTELTLARVERLKELFIERYDENEPSDKK